MTLKGKFALVTGASSGIGAAFARRAAAEGCDVGLVARRADRLEILAAELRADHDVEAMALPADLCEPAAPGKVVDAIAAAGRRVDVLVNNAGYSLRNVFAKTTLEQQRRFIELTVTAPVTFAHLVMPRMLEAGWGRIVNVSSITAFSSGGKGHTLYPAGKSFLVKFSQSLSAEARELGVCATAVTPAFVDTEFQEANDVADAMSSTPKFLVQTAAQIVDEAWTRAMRGDEVVVPGLLPKLGAMFLQYAPGPLVTPMTRAAAAKNYVGD
ncbi:MAG: SDR family NAD(P)-dependent oxidoreductase [Parvularculaceae bacterium]